MLKDSEIGNIAALGPVGSPPGSKYERLIARAKQVPPATTVVVHPCDETSLRGATEAAEAGIIVPILVGPAANLRFSAFNQRTTPEINGAISRISADVSADQRSGQNFYTIRISIAPEEVARLGKVKLVPGMPVEAFMKTYDRTVLSYFTKPLQDQILRAFRER
jgi:HlyD family secretion protein